MAEFDWVTARSNCSVVMIFERLKSAVQDDVNKRQQLRRKSEFGYQYGFSVDIDQTRISVILKEPTAPAEAVVFYLKEDSIDVVNGSGKHKFKATPTINDEGECRLKVSGQERELWQFRKMALEELFFRISD